jgi:hypothetical protein
MAKAPTQTNENSNNATEGENANAAEGTNEAVVEETVVEEAAVEEAEVEETVVEEAAVETVESPSNFGEILSALSTRLSNIEAILKNQGLMPQDPIEEPAAEETEELAENQAAAE